jgi:hypothetical protein
MRNLLVLSVLSLLTVSTTGCFHNCCSPGMAGGLFAKRAPAPQQCCQPVQCCPQPCCDPCAGGGMMGGGYAAPVTTMSPVMTTAPCCQ